jgi:hypothetical protein
LEERRIHKKIQELISFKERGFKTLQEIENYLNEQNAKSPSQEYETKSK